MNFKLSEMTASAFIMIAQLAIFVGAAAAQSTSPPPKLIAPAAARAQSQLIWDGYRSGTGQGDALELLNRLTSGRSLAATKENTTAILSSLRSNVSRDEKVALMRLAGMQHLELTDQKMRAEIEQYLSATATSANDPILGKAAALTYSRLGYFPDSLSVLSIARSRGFMTEDEYFGDLAHLLPAVPNQDQTVVLKQLQTGKNAYSREVLANLFKDKDLVAKLTTAAAADASNFLGKEEPLFPMAPNVLGGFDALKYENWFSATVVLNARLSGEPERVIVARMIKVDGADPRKLIAVLWTEQGGVVLRSAMDRSGLEKIDAAIVKYALANKSNAWIQEITGSARTNLAGAK